MDLGDVDIAGPDPGHPVGRFSRALERGPVSVILVERGELETVERLPRATNEDRLVGDRACPFLAGQDHGGGTIGDRRAHEQAQRARDHPRAEHLIERGALAEVGVGVPGRVIVVLDADEAELFLGRAIFRHVALGGQREARRRREAERGFPFTIHAGAHVEDGFGAFGLIQLLDAEHHHQVGEPGRDERVRVADADRPRRAHVLGASRQRRRLDAQRLGGQRRDVALERRALGHDGAHHQAFDVLRADAGHGIEARLARFPDQVAIARLADPELRHSRADQGDLPHGISPRRRRAAVVCPCSSAIASGVRPSSARTPARAPRTSSISMMATSPRAAARCSGR